MNPPKISFAGNFNDQAAVDAKKAAMLEELRTLLDTWEQQNANNDWDVNPTLRRISEILEEAMNDFMQQNPDPMDDRHPTKSLPQRPLGHLLKMVTRIESFVNRLVISYLQARDNTERNILAARLMLNLVPGIDTNVVLADADSLLTQLYRWAEDSDSRELRAYAMALLGEAMGAEQAHQYRQNNFKLIPIALQRLRELYAQMIQDYGNRDEQRVGPTNFAQLRQEEQQLAHEVLVQLEDEALEQQQPPGEEMELQQVEEEQQQKVDIQPMASRKRQSDRGGGSSPPPKRSNSLATMQPAAFSSSTHTANSLREAWNAVNTGFGERELGLSNSSWRQTMQPLLVGTYQLHPLSIEMEQRLIFHYLAPTSEYQDNVSILLEHHALDVVLAYLKMDGLAHICRDIRLLFDAIRYISSLLIHRKFAWEFVSAGGIQQLLLVNRKSMALTAVATCLYYLAYSVDIMEKVCHLPPLVISQLMDYALYALDHSHESGRASIAMFLAYALRFRAILDRFDECDGLRRLYNYVSTLTLIQKGDDDDMDNEEHSTQSVATIKNAILAFKCYLQSHIFLKMEHMKRSSRHAGQHRLPAMPQTIPSQAHPHSKPMKLDDGTERECMDYLIQSQCLLQPNNHNWKPIEEMRQLGIFQLLIKIVSHYPEWLHFERQGKADTLKQGLDVLRLATVSPKVQLDMCEPMKFQGNARGPVQGIGLVMEMVEGEEFSEPNVQRSSLEVLINCLCNPIDRAAATNYPLGVHYRFGKEFERDILPKEVAEKLPDSADSLDKSIGESSSAVKPGLDGKEKGVRLYLSPEQIQHVLWKCTQQNNAIMVLTKMLHKKEPATEADLLRELACRALNGISRFEPVRQILSKLPIIAGNELNALMQSPALIEKRLEHGRFCEQARLLIERVSQTNLRDFATMEMTQENLWRAAVVAQTRVKFNEKELLQLMYQHLADIGFKRTAKQLAVEAELPNIPASRIPTMPASLPGFPRQNAASFANIIARRANNHNKFQPSSAQPTPAKSQQQNNPNPTPSSGHGTRLPLKLCTPASSSSMALFQPGTSASTAFTPSGLAGGANASGSGFCLKVRPTKSLNEIVQSYFRNEHATCRNPVANCPPFSLFYPHRCPEPKLIYSAPTNFVSRLQSRSNPPFRCTAETLRQADRRLVFSRFRHWKTFSEESEVFTCGKFSLDDEHVFLGTYAGEMYVFNVRTGAVDATNNCHHSCVTAIRPRQNGLMLTSSAYVKPYSVLWRMEKNNGIKIDDRLIDFKEELFAEFGNLSTYQIVGTNGSKATVYDTETAKPVVTLFDERLANNYNRNRAYFDPLDELVLSDGILFDPRIGALHRVVHKFDKMNADISGVFHPRGTELIINREVWDLRTHRLLHTVPALDQCQVAFNSTGSILFGIVHQEPPEHDDRFWTIFSNYFRTFDSTNYEVISTHDTRKHLLDLDISNSDTFVGVVELGRTSDEDTNFFKIYEVGRRREEDEEDEDEQDEQVLMFQNHDEDEEDDEEEEDGDSASVPSSSTSTARSSSNNGEEEDEEEENNEEGEEEEEDSDAETVHSHGSGPDIIFLGEEDNDDTNQQQQPEVGAEVEHAAEEEPAMHGEEEEEQTTDDSSYSDEDFELSSSDFSP